MSLDLISVSEQVEVSMERECPWCEQVKDYPKAKKMHDMLWHGTAKERIWAQTHPWNVSGRKAKEIVLEAECGWLKYWIIE